ncbi:signal peptide peptidase SppA [Puniceicoccaceae bacterium K14]|nr:signal peptide peptidase SppA [Puniceicoccaceae bacterium K14]
MKDFFKMFFASTLALAFVCGALCAGVVLLLIGLSSMAESEPKLQKNSVLVFDMSSNIQDAPVSTTQEEIIAEITGGNRPPKLALRQVLTAIDTAASDKNIKGIFIKGSFRPDGYGSGFAALKEVREALVRFKEESAKPVIAHVVYPTARDLYVASAADTVYMNPEGLLLNSGMASQPMFLAGFFKKYGIGVQITKAGEFKSAAESLVRETMSGPARIQTEALLEDLWANYVDAVSSKADMSFDEFQALVDAKGLLTADDALEAGIVDELAFADQLLEELQEITGDSKRKVDLASIGLGHYIQLKTGEAAGGSHIAVVYAEGEIVTGNGNDGQIGGDKLAREIRQLRYDKSVKAIVLRVNSPGGSALASEVIQREVKLAQEQMPVVVSMGSVAASGGYWISAYSDRIFAQPNTITGSIGVIGLFMNFKEIANNHGVTFDLVKTAKFADVMSPVRPKTEEEMALIQKGVDEVYDDFLDRVSEGRDLDRDHVAEIAEGRVWSGEDALEIGIVDELGGLGDAIAHAAELAELGNNPTIRDYPAPVDFFEELLKGLANGEQVMARNEALQAVKSTLDELRALSQFDDPKGVYAIMPYKIEIK